MAIHVRFVLLLFLATLPLSAQTNPAPAPSATKAQEPTTDSKVVPKQPTPTVFQADEGDRWVLLGTSRSFSRLIPSVPVRTHWSSGPRRCHQETKFRPTSICTKMRSFSYTRVRYASRWLDVNTTQERERPFSSLMETGSAWRTFPVSLP